LGANVPLFPTKKEVFPWLLNGKKTIDIRKGNLRRGDTAVFQSGAHILRLKILKNRSGQLTEIVRTDNFGQVIPWAKNLGEATAYLRELYPGYAGVFTAYYVEPPQNMLRIA
jgi:hypothetical protein